MTRRARNFLTANADSPVVYGSVDGNAVVYRLENGKLFHLTRADCEHAQYPRWAHHREMA